MEERPGILVCFYHKSNRILYKQEAERTNKKKVIECSQNSGQMKVNGMFIKWGKRRKANKQKQGKVRKEGLCD